MLNTSFDVIDNYVLDMLRSLKHLLEHNAFTDQNMTYCLMIENQISFILIRLDEQANKLIKKKRKWLEDFLKNNVPGDDKQRADALRAGTELFISKITLKKNDPNDVHLKMKKK